MRRLLTTAAALLALTAPLAAQAPAGPEKVSIEFDAARLNLVVKAIGAGLVKNEADPLLAHIQAAVNAAMAEWQKAHPPEAKPAPFPPVPPPAPLPKQ